MAEPREPWREDAVMFALQTQRTLTEAAHDKEMEPRRRGRPTSFPNCGPAGELSDSQVHIYKISPGVHAHGSRSTGWPLGGE